MKNLLVQLGLAPDSVFRVQSPRSCVVVFGEDHFRIAVSAAAVWSMSYPRISLGFLSIKKST